MKASARLRNLAKKLERIIAGLIWIAIGLSSSSTLGAEPASSVAQTQWTSRLQQGRFQILADFELADNQSFLSELSSTSSGVCDILKLPRTGQPIHIVLFGNAKEYSRYIKNYFPTAPERRALFIQGRGPGMLFAHWHNDVLTDIRHEVVHGLLNDQANPLPIWLDEGLAEYFEVAEKDRLANNPHLIEIRHELNVGNVPALEDLEALNQIEQLGNVQYRDSWAWVHFMLHRSPHTRHQLVQQLGALRAGEPQMPLSRQIASAWPNWRTEFAEHFHTLAK